MPDGPQRASHEFQIALFHGPHRKFGWGWGTFNRKTLAELTAAAAE
jgi:hypothetical protein